MYIVILDSQLLHNKFQVIYPVILKKKIFKVFNITGHGSHLGHVTWMLTFPIPFAWRLHVYLTELGPAVSEEKPFENVDERQTGDL